MKLKFPHIPRKITAPLIWYTEKIGLWAALTGLILVNLYARANLTPSYWEKLIAALELPYASQNHLDLARSLWQEGAALAAERELIFAGSLASSSQLVLGATTGPENLLREWRAEPARLAGEYRFWQTIASEKSDYRDAHLTLAALAYQLSRFNEAKVNIDRALRLDPNSEIGSKLRGLLLEK